MTSKGHIYMIFTPLDNSFSYIGSTFNRIHKRFQGHKDKFKKWLKDKNKNTKCSIFDYFEKYGIENFKIILIKSYNVVRTHQKDDKHLHAYELLWINKTKNCVNKLLPFNPLKKLELKEYRKKYTKENKEKQKEYQKKYRENNKEKKAEKDKEYSEKNKEKIAEYQKKHYENNKEALKKKNKEYRENNKEKILEKKKKHYKNNKQKILEKQKEYTENNKESISAKKKEKYTCVCGSIIAFSGKSKHEKTKIHIQYFKKK
jgi:hypothetical protein